MIKINEVYFVDLSPAVGKEFAGIRKCKIDKIYNEDLIRVIPFSRLDNKYHTEQARAVDIKRLREKVSDQEVVEVPTANTVSKERIDETLKCLESCIGKIECKNCPKKEVLIDCVGELLKDSFELIKELKEEREAFTYIKEI